MSSSDTGRGLSLVGGRNIHCSVPILRPISMSGLTAVAAAQGVWLMGPSGAGKNRAGYEIVRRYREANDARDLSYFDVDSAGSVVKGHWVLDVAAIPFANVLIGQGRNMEHSRHMHTHLKVLVVPTWEVFAIANLAKAVEKLRSTATGQSKTPSSWIEGWLNAFRFSFDEYAAAFPAWIEKYSVMPDAVYYAPQDSFEGIDIHSMSGWDRSMDAPKESERNRLLIAKQAGQRVAVSQKESTQPSTSEGGCPSHDDTSVADNKETGNER